MKVFELLKLVAVTLLYLVINVAVSYLVVAVYAYLIHPGESEEYYQKWALASAPWSSVVAGMPLMFALGWWVSRWKSTSNPALAMGIVWITYVVLDLGIITIGGGMTRRLAAFVVVSLATKLIAGQWGARVGSRSRTA